MILEGKILCETIYKSKKKWNDFPLPNLILSVFNILNLIVLRRLFYWKVLT